MELRDALRAIKRLWPVVVAAVLVAVAVMWAITPAAVDTTRKVGSYQAIAVLLVQPRAQPSPTPTPRTTPTRRATPSRSPTPTPTPEANPISPAQAVNRVALLVKAGEIPHWAARTLGASEEADALVAQLDVTADAETGTVFISTRGKDGQRVTEVANAFARETVRYFEAPRPEVVDGDVTLLEEATPLPFAPAREYVVPPDRAQRLIVAAFLGLLAGFALAVLLGLLDTRIRTSKDVRGIIGLPVLAEVPRRSRLVRDPRHNPRADAYRIAESTLASLPRSTGTDLNLLLVTSSLGGEEVAESVIQLAGAFAEAGSSVLIIEANLRAPGIARLLDVPAGAGVAEWVANPAAGSVGALLHPTAIPGVRLISAGLSIEDPAAVGSRLAPLLSEARGLADFVIIDAPPMLAASEVYDLVPMTDAVVLVVGYNKLTRPVGQRVGELLQRFDSPVLSAILVGVPIARRRRQGRRKQARRGASRLALPAR